MNRKRAGRLRQTLRRFRAALILLVLYLATHIAFVAVSAEHVSVISPAGQTNLTVLLLGGAVIVLRLVSLFFLPAIVIYKLLALLDERIARKRQAPGAYKPPS